ncbi:MAG: hypothetical protein JRE40_11615 [Deltaproteobacteria bacterium]|nr:hypothetical protein [Deltaproteobacteria bacterium]
MALTVYNPQKGRLETISVELTTENTTRFTPCGKPDDIATITDFNGDLLIADYGRDYPIRIYDASRSQISYDQVQVKELLHQTLR